MTIMQAAAMFTMWPLTLVCLIGALDMALVPPEKAWERRRRRLIRFGLQPTTEPPPGWVRGRTTEFVVLLIIGLGSFLIPFALPRIFG